MRVNIRKMHRKFIYHPRKVEGIISMEMQFKETINIWEQIPEQCMIKLFTILGKLELLILRYKKVEEMENKFINKPSITIMVLMYQTVQPRNEKINGFEWE